MNRTLIAILSAVAVVGFVKERTLAAELPPLAVAPFDGRQAAEFQQQWGRQIGKPVVYTNSIGMKLSLLPPGEFLMGRSNEQFDTLLDTVKNNPEMKRNYGGQVVWSMLMMPAHRVRLTKPFYMGTTEVTVGQFRQFAEASGYKTEAEQGLDAGEPIKGRPICTWRKPMVWINLQQKDDEPVLHLCYNDCVEFCKWLSKKDDVEYCLPTEAEWEYACRAGASTPWSFGDWQSVPRVAHEYAFWSEAPQGKHDRPRSVAQGKPNAFGLYDMHGNVWEYVADWWHRMYYKESPLNDPTGPETQDELNRLRRIIRGSSFDWDSWGGDAAYRMRIGQRSTQHPHMGFRVAMRLKDVAGVPPAVDPDEERRSKRRDPGADSPEVLTALQRGAANVKLDRELSIAIADGINLEFVLIPAGSFLMGSEKGLRDEKPVHRVVISKPFYMAKYELTQSQWEALMGKHPWLEELRKASDHDGIGPTKAMDTLSWTACRDFIGKLKAKVPTHDFALPTEAQWEYACRAGSSTEFHFGDDESQLGDYAWFHGNMNWVGQPGFKGKLFYHDVGAKKPNAFGLYDMHGGVWEWCADWYDENYYFNSPLADPTGPDAGRFRILRGGSWFRFGKYARSSYRKVFHPDGDGDATTAYINDFGCRLVINLPASIDHMVPNEGPDHAVRIRRPYRIAAHELTLGQFRKFVEATGYQTDAEREVIDPASDQVRRTWTDEPAFKNQKEDEPALNVSWNDGDDRSRFGEYAWCDGNSGGRPHSVGTKKPNAFGLFDMHGNMFEYAADFFADVDFEQRFGPKPPIAIDPTGILWGTRTCLRGGSFDTNSYLRRSTTRLGGATRFQYIYHMGVRLVMVLGDDSPSEPVNISLSGRRGRNAHPVAQPPTRLIKHESNPVLEIAADGTHWTKVKSNPILNVGDKDAWDGGAISAYDVQWHDGQYHVWYAATSLAEATAAKREPTLHIGYATGKPDDRAAGDPR